MKIKKTKFKLQPTQILVIGFCIIIWIGTVLLNLPIASAKSESLGFLDALFTATSAVCVTGMTVVDTGTYFSLFGQIVIISLVQIGGLGFMTMATTVFLLLGKRITLRERLVIQEALNEDTLQGLVALTRNIMLTTFLIELIGAALLSVRFIPIYGFAKGMYFALFHSISSFCNAGFDLFGGYRSLVPFANDPVIILTIGSLVVVGGLGFTVILDIYRHRGFRRICLHSKIVLSVTAILIVVGFIFFYVVEFNNPKTIGSADLTQTGKVLSALFQSITPRTAGYNSIDQDAMTNASKFMTIIIMFIGASPASTGGGIKTTTASLIFLMMLAVVKGQDDMVIFKRRISHSIGMRALAIAVISLSLLVGVTMVVSLAEAGKTGPMFSFVNIFYEVASAFGTVGLTTGITRDLTDISKVFLILTMFAGRLGPLTLTLAFARRHSRKKPVIRYPEDKLMIG
ncbi:MAG: TrkH family potassium uptake protein [Clostridia bacterium]